MLKHIPGRRSDRVYRRLREAPDTAEISAAARRAFDDSYPDVKVQPLVVVIAAYNEAANIGLVLDEIPDQIGDVAATRLVVDDASSDRTADTARRHGALVCRLQANRGQGAALRVGYRIARDRGARYIATLDADGQWDPADFAQMMGLVESDVADVVVGSRQLGSPQNPVGLRNERVRLFAWLASRLTGVEMTDVSSGLRLMRAEVTAAVRQTQPQYQAVELLIGAVILGFRVAEVPTAIRARISGVSRKGGDLSCALRYSLVIVRTWWRDRKAAPAINCLAGLPSAGATSSREYVDGAGVQDGKKG